jgi:hypothetical protein
LLAVFAIFSAWYARKAFRTQRKEVSGLEEQQRREAAEREWATGKATLCTLVEVTVVSWAHLMR